MAVLDVSAVATLLLALHAFAAGLALHEALLAAFSRRWHGRAARGRREGGVPARHGADPIRRDDAEVVDGVRSQSPELLGDRMVDGVRSDRGALETTLVVLLGRPVLEVVGGRARVRRDLGAEAR